MDFQAVSTNHSDYLEIKASTDYSIDRLFRFLDHVHSEVERTGHDHVLIDSRDFRGSMTEADRFMGGQRIAEIFGRRIKVALVMPADQITKLGEITATNRGGRFFVSQSNDEALDWLRDPET